MFCVVVKHLLGVENKKNQAVKQSAQDRLVSDFSSFSTHPQPVLVYYLMIHT
jgi:hypothetical protein